jgi:hypothetical protein
MIYAELAKIQKELKAPKNQFNAFGKYHYRSCEDILEAVKPLLGSLALVISDEVIQIGNRIYIKATVALTDGKETVLNTAWAREEEDKKGMDGSQITGAASSYARKYALNGMFLIDDNKDSDSTNEHGKKETPQPEPKPAPQAPQTPPPSNGVEPQKHDGLDQKQMQAKIGEWLLVMMGNEQSAQAKLEELTTWTNSKNEVVKGKTNPFQLNVKPNAKGQTQTSVTYTQVRKMWNEFTGEEVPF